MKIALIIFAGSSIETNNKLVRVAKTFNAELNLQNATASFVGRFIIAHVLAIWLAFAQMARIVHSHILDGISALIGQKLTRKLLLPVDNVANFI